MTNDSHQKMCIVVPAITLAVAHWFPWKQVIGHDLHRLEAYAIGTATIVGTAAVAIADEESGTDAAKLLLITAVSAGTTTLLAWMIDAVFMNRGGS